MPLPRKSSMVKFWEIFKFFNSCGRDCNKMYYQKLYTHTHKSSICTQRFFFLNFILMLFFLILFLNFTQRFCAFFFNLYVKANKYMTEAQITTKFLTTLIFVYISSSQVIVDGLRSAGRSLRNNTLHNTQHKRTLIKCELLLYLLNLLEQMENQACHQLMNKKHSLKME